MTIPTSKKFDGELLPAAANKYLIIITGPTAVGKTSLTIKLAQYYHTEIISADSRQFYREMNIGTAKPSSEELSMVKHHLIDTLSVSDYYNVYRYESDVMAILEHLFSIHNIVFLTGGSGLFINAVCNGIDDIPDHVPELRDELNSTFEKSGIQPLRDRLKLLDPEAYKKMDIANHKRIIRALEVCLSTGKTYSSFLNKKNSTRPFNIIKIGLERERSELNEIINRRVDSMMESGLEDEARSLYPLRNLSSLQTVGYKELFDYFDGKYSLEQAIEKIKTNTRRYAKKQMAWFARDKSIGWFKPSEADEIMKFIATQIPPAF